MSLATAGPLTGPVAPVRPAPDSTPPGSGRGDVVAFWVFVGLVVLGMLAAARAFLVM